MSRQNPRPTTVPKFETTTDLVEYSLGIQRQGGGVGIDELREEMEVDDDDYEEVEEESASQGGSGNVNVEGGGSASEAHAGTSQELSAYYNASEQDERIRTITNEYLEGRLSLLEFASVIEHYRRLGLEADQDHEAEGDDEETPSQKPAVPSLVLLNPENVNLNQPSTSSSSYVVDEAEKLRGEFFRSGDVPTTFSIRKRRKMPPTIKNLMGEAHVRFAKGDLVGAETICMEVIKEQPTYKDPFHTLAVIYESQDNRSKALQFYLICALLDPKRFEEWPRLAELSMEEDNIQQAIMCLNKALTSEPSNVKLHLKRCQLLKQTGDEKLALKGYQKVFEMTSDGKTKMDVAKEISQIFFNMGEMPNAYEFLRTTIDEYPGHVTFFELNLFAEICITVKKYVEALDLFMRHGSVKFSPEIDAGEFENREKLTNALALPKRDCKVTDGLHSDVVQKIAIVLIHLEAFKLAEQIVNRLLAVEDINDFGLQLFEIAEAYIAKKENRAALRLLNPLINSENFSEAEVWLRYAECLYMINKLEDAAVAYQKVISLAPNHKIAKLNLSIILQKLGRYDGALESLNQNNLEDRIDHDLVLERCKIFLNQGRIPEFFESALRLFSRHCPNIRGLDEAQVLISTSNTLQQLEGLNALRFQKNEPVSDHAVEFEEKPLENPFKEWRIYVLLLRIFLSTGRYDLLQRLTYTTWCSKLFSLEPGMKLEIDFHTTFASALNGDQELSPGHFRSLFSAHPVSTLLLNVLSLAIRRSTRVRYSKQIVRLLKKYPSDLRLMLLSAHNSFSTGTYKYALIEYLQIIKEIPTNPQCHLMVAITLMHMISQRTTSNRMRLVLYMVGFLRKYMELRGRCQESYYNVARAYHFLGFYSQALRYYKKVLTTKPVEDNEYFGGVPVIDDGSQFITSTGNQMDLSMEAAYNIAHIYKSLGMERQAKMYIFNYIKI